MQVIKKVIYFCLRMLFHARLVIHRPSCTGNQQFLFHILILSPSLIQPGINLSKTFSLKKKKKSELLNICIPRTVSDE